MAYLILFIENDAETVALVKRALEARNYRFMAADSGEAGIETAEIYHPDVILVGMRQTDMDGCEIVRRLRKSGEKPLMYAPIIAVIENAYRGDAEKALAAGSDVYLAKPINIRELWARVEGFLGGTGE